MFCIVRPVEQEMRAAKMDVDLLKHEIEINSLRKQIMSRKMPPSMGTFPLMVKLIYKHAIQLRAVSPSYFCLSCDFESLSPSS